MNVEEYTLVLVVEPDDEARIDMLNALRGAGFPTVGVRTFDHAREQILIDPPKVLVTESRLGSYSGFHLAYIVRQRRPACQAVILADLPDASLERDALQAGAAILARPLPADTLPRVLAMLLGRYASRPLAAAVPSSTDRRHGERRQVVIPGYMPERRLADRRRTAWIPAT